MLGQTPVILLSENLIHLATSWLQPDLYVPMVAVAMGFHWLYIFKT